MAVEGGKVGGVLPLSQVRSWRANPFKPPNYRSPPDLRARSNLDMPLETSDRKILILGVDGGTFELIQPMIDRGLLPTFARLMKEGASGARRGSLPEGRPGAWGTFIAG